MKIIYILLLDFTKSKYPLYFTIRFYIETYYMSFSIVGQKLNK